MSTILHISDTHFGTEQPEVVEALLQLVKDQAPDLLILSGDVTMRARRAQFMAAKQFLARVRVPDIMVLPGNHDIPLYNVVARFFSPYGNYERAFGSDLEPRFHSRDLMVLGVNTTRPSRHTQGTVSADQINSVSRRLMKATPSQLRIVVTHQPVRATTDSDIKNLLRGHEEAVLAWSKAGADMILSGHVHLPHVRPLQEVFPHLPRPVWSILAGTAVSKRVRGDIPNSVNIIRYLQTAVPRQCTVERWDYSGGHGFILCERLTLHLQS